MVFPNPSTYLLIRMILSDHKATQPQISSLIEGVQQIYEKLTLALEKRATSDLATSSSLTRIESLLSGALWLSLGLCVFRAAKSYVRLHVAVNAAVPAARNRLSASPASTPIGLRGSGRWRAAETQDFAAGFMRARFDRTLDLDRDASAPRSGRYQMGFHKDGEHVGSNCDNEAGGGHNQEWGDGYEEGLGSEESWAPSSVVATKEEVPGCDVEPGVNMNW
ncbi:hypothetical protein LTS18_010795 [Coniosporium uncinatum]|uniref:Uncharacterized protein n=1 Tax=Coniosporium uncinatum TaxID=93489 RepID=A0ACC3CZD7_9PEZI|nr:hypothetical protein LTS18_010795 [Coniosporium uncinatum]